MLKRILLSLLLYSATYTAHATDYTDIYYIPAESGWGVNVVQADNTLFLTFFIYGSDNKPTWYTAILNRDVNGNFNGKLYATTGTYFAMPWKASDYAPTEVGTASFQPTGPDTGKLIYTVTNISPPVTVTKAIQRQTLTSITIGGSYIGAQSGVYSGCNSASSNGGYSDFFSLQVNQSSNGNVTFSFAYGGNLSCTYTGTLTQFGQLYKIPTTAYRCSTGLNTNASMSEIKATAQGIEGKFSAPSVGGGCREDATFSAVLH